MSYYRIIGLEREPFSTSPDPEFFYQSREHKSVLYRLRISVDLRRGLNLILGDVGTGKTTLSRKLAQLFKAEANLTMVMVLNPTYESEREFLTDLSERFHFDAALRPGQCQSVLEYMKSAERFLFEEGVEKNKTIVLLIDEAQKLSDPCFEILRTLLNYETNDYKILQVVLMGQMELLPRISQVKNLWDRVALKYVINPLEEEEAGELISFRLKQAGYVSRYPLFTDGAIEAICRYTQGYPRKIAMLCHDALEYMVMYNKETVDRDVIQELARKEIKPAYSDALIKN